MKLICLRGWEVDLARGTTAGCVWPGLQAGGHNHACAGAGEHARLREFLNPGTHNCSCERTRFQSHLLMQVSTRSKAAPRVCVGLPGGLQISSLNVCERTSKDAMTNGCVSDRLVPPLMRCSTTASPSPLPESGGAWPTSEPSRKNLCDLCASLTQVLWPAGTAVTCSIHSTAASASAKRAFMRGDAMRHHLPFWPNRPHELPTLDYLGPPRQPAGVGAR